MKFSPAFFFALLLSFAFSAVGIAQNGNRGNVSAKIATQQPKVIVPSKVRLRTDAGIKIVDYISKSKLQEGRNFLRFGNRRMFIGVQKSKIMSIKVMDRMGQWGPNVLATGQQVQEFTCVGGICWCSGDNDCNNMFTSTVCGDAAVCIDDKCYCAQN